MFSFLFKIILHVANFTEELYEEFVEYRSYFVSSTNAIMEVQQEERDVLIEIRDILKKSIVTGKSSDELNAPESGASIKGAFKNINELFKNELKSVFKDFNKFFGDMTGMKDAPTAEFTKFIADFMKAITMDGEYKDPKELGKLYSSVGEGFKLLSEAIIPMSKGLILFSFAAKTKGPEKFIDYLDKLLSKDLMKKTDSKKVKKDAEAMEAVAKGIFSFGLYLALSAPLLLIGIPVAIIAIPIITGLLALMGLVSKNSKGIKRSASAIKDLALGLLIFSASLALISFIEVDFVKVIGVIGLFLLFTAAVTLISKLAGGKDMKNAAISVGILSGALALFALSTMLFEEISWGALIKAALSITLLSLLTLVLGANKKGVMFAAIGMLVIVGALALLAFTVKMYDDIGWDTLAKAGATLLVVTLMTYIMGANKAGVIFAGIGMLLMTGSIYLLSLALQEYKNLEWDDIAKFGASIAAIVIAVNLLSNPVALIGGLIIAGVALAIAASIYIITEAFHTIIQSLAEFKALGWTENDSVALGSMFTGIINGIIKPFESDNIFKSVARMYAGVAGTAMTLVISLAIGHIVGALKTFKDAGLTEDDAGLLGSVISGTINGVMKPFESTGFFEFAGKLISGVAGTGMLAVITLTIGEIMEALTLFKKADLTEDDANRMSNSIHTVLSNIKGIIEDIGSSAGWFTDSDFEDGLESFGSFGKALKNIADGTVAMANMTFTDPVTGVKTSISETQVQAAANNIKHIIEALKKPIMEIGATTGTGPFGGKMFAETTFEDGIEAVMGTGKMLLDIAKGVQDVANLTFSDPRTGEKRTLTDGDFTLVGTNVIKVITALQEPISSIGKKGYFRAKSDFQRGIESATIAATMVGDVAKAIKEVLALKFTDSTGNLVQLENADFELVGQKVGALVTALQKPISAIGEKGFWRNKSEFKRGVESLKDMAGSLSGTSKEIGSLLGTGLMTDVLDYEEFEKRSIIFTNMIDSITKLGDKKDAVVTATKAAIAMNNSTIDVFKAINKATTDKLDKTKELFASLVELDSVGNNLFAEKLQAVESLIDKTGDVSDKLEAFNKLIKPEGSEEMKQMVILMQNMIIQQANMIQAINNVTTVLQGVLKVEDA